ncbi:MAG: DNA cytosine methyltransferase, partial [Oscillospiraceae bacterium]
MKGGKRQGAGRVALSVGEKKEGCKIYITPQLKNEIEQYGTGISFSEKCSSLIAQQILNLKSQPDNTIRYIDLFAGLGGIRLGFSEAFKKLGFQTECVFSSEIKPYAIDAYKRFFNESFIAGDITKIKSEEIPNFDFLLAG